VETQHVDDTSDLKEVCSAKLFRISGHDSRKGRDFAAPGTMLRRHPIEPHHRQSETILPGHGLEGPQDVFPVNMGSQRHRRSGEGSAQLKRRRRSDLTSRDFRNTGQLVNELGKVNPEHLLGVRLVVVVVNSRYNGNRSWDASRDDATWGLETLNGRSDRSRKPTALSVLMSSNGGQELGAGARLGQRADCMSSGRGRGSLDTRCRRTCGSSSKSRLLQALGSSGDGVAVGSLPLVSTFRGEIGDLVCREEVSFRVDVAGPLAKGISLVLFATYTG
jgi:hypothetical protein